MDFATNVQNAIALMMRKWTMTKTKSKKMAKGDYSSKWGGSRNAYEKGQRDSKYTFFNRLIDVIGDIAKAVSESNKRR
ncbi:hypothetical protein [Algoriphagus sp. PAP.12]|uniref:hypothetical protein n=1 Tax=Algoriphagus sp. PAP.12 TaxID=2996678 RepID=UPI00227B1846|nr:hypothetical protein [Algoriphagus sp. PAP.12]